MIRLVKSSKGQISKSPPAPLSAHLFLALIKLIRLDFKSVSYHIIYVTWRTRQLHLDHVTGQKGGNIVTCVFFLLRFFQHHNIHYFKIYMMIFKIIFLRIHYSLNLLKFCFLVNKESLTDTPYFLLSSKLLKNEISNT